MESIIFVPGGSGSRLELNSVEIWPPTPLEMMIGYSRLSELQDQNAKVTQVIDAISCVDVYKPLQDDLAAIANHLGCTYVDFPYDWRTNIFSSANQLAQTIISSVANGATQITLVGHSMGNLVIRALLEGGGHHSEAWFKKITRYVGICGPHLGVPRILEYALGQKSYLGISAQDMKTLSANPDYAACYQCLPFQGQQVLWDFRTNPPKPLDFYNPKTASAFGFNPQNLAAAIDLQKKLKDFANKPTHTQYSLIAGSDQKTDEAIEYEGSNHYWVYPDQLGDGMVPLWSGAIQQCHPQTTPGDHLGIFKTYPFKQILYDVLTHGAFVPPLTLADQTGVAGVALSVDRFTYSPDELISVLIVPDVGTQEISGALQIMRLTDLERRRFAPYRDPVLVEYRGPPISRLATTIHAPTDLGAYCIVLSGRNGTSEHTAGAFVVSQVSDAAIERRRP
jgi:hypothetical protein